MSFADELRKSSVDAQVEQKKKLKDEREAKRKKTLNAEQKDYLDKLIIDNVTEFREHCAIFAKRGAKGHHQHIGSYYTYTNDNFDTSRGYNPSEFGSVAREYVTEKFKQILLQDGFTSLKINKKEVPCPHGRDKLFGERFYRLEIIAKW